jgi:uncharacterized protein (DUF924 family)
VNAGSPREVLDFWFKEISPDRWFDSDAAFDAELRRRFEETWRAAREGKLKDWEETGDGALALVIVLDQLPRNMFRGNAQAFSTDALAREVAQRALDRGFDLGASPDAKNFLYLPLMHSEHLADQDSCVRLTRERLGESHSSYPFALRHRDAITRFGRFPGRNRALSRASTPEEEEFLAKHPSGF